MTENNQGILPTPDPREIQKVRLGPDLNPTIKLTTLAGPINLYGPETGIIGSSSFAALEDFLAGETMS